MTKTDIPQMSFLTEEEALEVFKRLKHRKPPHVYPPNPFEVAGLKIIEKSGIRPYYSIIYEGWQERHPDRDYSRRFAFPDAVSYCGQIIPRVKLYAELTDQDERDWEVNKLVLAKDRSLGEAQDAWGYH